MYIYASHLLGVLDFVYNLEKGYGKIVQNMVGKGAR